MVVTSVVTYTFPIGPFLGAPSSRYGPSVDWGDHSQHQHGDWSWRTSSVSHHTFIIALQIMHLKAKTEGAKVLNMFREMFLKVLIVK